MRLQRIQDELLQTCRQTLKECSKDDAGIPVTNSEQEAYNFDRLSALEAEKYRRKMKLCSADALFIKNEYEIFFFEFKNTRKSHIPWKSVHMKAHDSVLALQVLLFPELSLHECAQRVWYFLIYNEKVLAEKENESASFDKFKAVMKNLAKEPEGYPVLGHMEQYENTFYKKVYTIDAGDFEQKFIDKIYRNP